MDNLEEMDRFLEKFNLPRLKQEEIEIMNNQITSTEIEALIKNLLRNTIPEPGNVSQENANWYSYYGRGYGVSFKN